MNFCKPILCSTLVCYLTFGLASGLSAQQDELEAWQDALDELQETTEEIREVDGEIAAHQKWYEDKYKGQDPFGLPGNRKEVIEWQAKLGRLHKERQAQIAQFDKQRKAANEAYQKVRQSFARIEEVRTLALETIAKLHGECQGFPNYERAVATIERGLQKMEAESGYRHMDALGVINELLAAMSPEDLAKGKLLEALGSYLGPEVQEIADHFSDPLMDKLKDKIQGKTRKEFLEWVGKAKKAIQFYRAINPESGNGKIREMERIVAILDLTIDAMPEGADVLVKIQKKIVEEIYKRLQDFQIELHKLNIQLAWYHCASTETARTVRQRGDHWNMNRIGKEENWFSDVPDEPQIKLVTEPGQPIFVGQSLTVQWEGSISWHRKAAWIGIHRVGRRQKDSALSRLDLSFDFSRPFGNENLQAPARGGDYEIVLYDGAGNVAASTPLKVAGTDAQLKLGRRVYRPGERFSVNYLISADLDDPAVAIYDPTPLPQPKHDAGEGLIPDIPKDFVPSKLQQIQYLPTSGDAKNAGRRQFVAPRQEGTYLVGLYEDFREGEITSVTFEVRKEGERSDSGGVGRLMFEDKLQQQVVVDPADDASMLGGLAGRVEEDVTIRMSQKEGSQQTQQESAQAVAFFSFDAEVKHLDGGQWQLRLQARYDPLLFKWHLDEIKDESTRQTLRAEFLSLVDRLDSYRRILTPDEVQALETHGRVFIEIQATEFAKSPFSVLNKWKLQSVSKVRLVKRESNRPLKNQTPR